MSIVQGSPEAQPCLRRRRRQFSRIYVRLGSRQIVTPQRCLCFRRGGVMERHSVRSLTAGEHSRPRHGRPRHGRPALSYTLKVPLGRVPIGSVYRRFSSCQVKADMSF